MVCIFVLRDWGERIEKVILVLLCMEAKTHDSPQSALSLELLWSSVSKTAEHWSNKRRPRAVFSPSSHDIHLPNATSFAHGNLSVRSLEALGP